MNVDTADAHLVSTSTPACILSPKRELLSLSDEILELVIAQADRHDDLPYLRLSCKKLLDLSERYMYRNFVVALPEDIDVQKWRSKLETMPDSIKLIKYLTIMNQNMSSDGFFCRNVVPCPNSYRIQRWGRLEHAAQQSKTEFEKAAFFKGSKFRWGTKLDQNQLISFRWRHATALSYELLCKIMTSQANSLQELEVSMITPPSTNEVGDFARAIEPKTFPKLTRLIYHGLSHTEPIPQNYPAKGGRFRMIRPLFRKTYEVLKELNLSQEHCISQVGKTPLINGRTFNSFLCDLDDIYHHAYDPCYSTVPSVTLGLEKLELGGFKVEALFDSPAIPTVAPRVRINLPSLQRLVLNECDGLGQLLKELTLRKQDVHFTEVGFRVKEQYEDNHTEDWDEVAESLEGFLMSFEGLQVLSILWHGEHAPEASKFSKVLVQHKKSLQVYSFAARNATDNDMGIFRFSAKPPTTPSPWTGVLPSDTRPQLREIGFDLPDQLCTESYPALRLLSQFTTLRTAHIRHFPKFARVTDDGETQYWRDPDGSASDAAQTQAARFAELIALPYFDLPTEANTASTEDPNDLEGFQLQSLADLHAEARDNRLQPGFDMKKAIMHARTPVVNATPLVLRYRADTDFRFSNIMYKVQDGIATPEEMGTYETFYGGVRRVLGYSKPSQDDKPKLRLIVVGDWRYRDQLNLAGPRTWNPDVWSTPRGSNTSARRDAYDDDSEDEYDDDDVALYADGSDGYGAQNTRLRYGFFKEFDVSLLPIFFKITWHAVQDKGDATWRWKAEAHPLNHSTVEGYGWLGDVKSLDFAWQS